MTKGSCDPAPEPYNVMEMSEGGGDMLVRILWSWDGISVWPQCAGPIVSGRIWNTGTRTWYAHFIGRRGQPRTIAIPPGTDVTRDATWLAQRGIQTLADLDGFLINDTP